jgi:hypothetical protein
MANLFGGAGTAVNTAGGGTAGGGDWTAVSPLVIPELRDLYMRAQGAVPSKMQSVQDMVAGGMNSPLLQAVLGPALQRLVQPQAAQREQLTDIFRDTGGLKGGQYGVRMNDLLTNQSQQQNDLMAQVLGQVLNPLLSAQIQEQRNQFLPAQTYADILQAARPNFNFGSNARSSSSSSGWESIAPSLGLGTPMSGDRISGPRTALRTSSPYSRGELDNTQYDWSGNPIKPGAAPSMGGDPWGGFVDPISVGGGGDVYWQGNTMVNEPASMFDPWGGYNGFLDFINNNPAEAFPYSQVSDIPVDMGEY